MSMIIMYQCGSHFCGPLPNPGYQLKQLFPPTSYRCNNYMQTEVLKERLCTVTVLFVWSKVSDNVCIWFHNTKLNVNVIKHFKLNRFWNSERYLNKFDFVFCLNMLLKVVIQIIRNNLNSDIRWLVSVNDRCTVKIQIDMISSRSLNLTWPMIITGLMFATLSSFNCTSHWMGPSVAVGLMWSVIT